MSKVKDFIVNNQMIATAIAIVLLIALIIAAAVTPLGRSEKSERQTTTANETTTGKKGNTDEEETSTENETTTVTETQENESSEEETEETGEENTTEEETTNITEQVEYPYIIKVNRAANCITVYGKDANGEYTVPVKAITVSCGKNIEDTPLGEYNTIISYDWRLMFDGTYGHYAYRIVGSTLFHSVPYYTASNDDLEWMEYNKLGSPASLGCVRMTVADAKWLVENCPIGTKVIIYDDASNPGPLGKPETIKIPSDSPYRGWDPTDPNPNNPWHQFSATISYPSSKIIEVDKGTSVSKLRSYFSAKDTCGNDVSSKIKISGVYDLNKPGTYKNITVSITDAIGSYAEVKVTVVVNEKEVTTTTQAPTTTRKPSQSEVTTTTSDETKASEETSKNMETSEDVTTEKEEETTSEMENGTEPITTEIEDNNEN